MPIFTSHDADHHHPVHTFEARNIALSYENHTVINDLSLAIPSRQVGAIIGPNGCCKSTLLKALARLITPDRGSVLLDGTPINTLPTREVATKIGLLPQTPIAPEGITVANLVARGRYPYHGFNGGWNSDDEQAVAHALSVTNLTELTDRPIEELSGGQRQRAWIALALAQETDILLLDEPITYLDIAYQIEVLDLLSRLNSSEGVTIVMVLHDLNLAARYADWILAMKDGRKMALGTPEEVITPSLLSEVFGLDTSVSIDPTTQLPMMMPGGGHCLATQRTSKPTATAAEPNDAQ
jgi:iron complex transport system ATP-binding protein